jgi:hypothetical protein
MSRIFIRAHVVPKRRHATRVMKSGTRSSPRPSRSLVEQYRSPSPGAWRAPTQFRSAAVTRAAPTCARYRRPRSRPWARRAESSVMAPFPGLRGGGACCLVADWCGRCGLFRILPPRSTLSPASPLFPKVSIESVTVCNLRNINDLAPQQIALCCTPSPQQGRHFPQKTMSSSLRRCLELGF